MSRSIHNDRACPSLECPLYGQLGRGNIIRHSFISLQFVGFSLIVLAGLGLVGALVQSLRIDKRLSAQGYARVEPTPLGLVMAILVLLVGVLGVFAIYL